ncbi:MAG: HPr family phosphocarrier protein [Lachnospiraceae bacterium]|nr:HPr family phosphocarrier protein [Lachnospiraceae bacterium]
MIRKHIIITNPSGLSVDPACLLSKHARQYDCTATLYYKHYNINVKSMMHILSAALANGTEAELVCCGTDEEQCINDLCRLFAQGLEQEEP